MTTLCSFVSSLSSYWTELTLFFPLLFAAMALAPDSDVLILIVWDCFSGERWLILRNPWLAELIVKVFDQLNNWIQLNDQTRVTFTIGVLSCLLIFSIVKLPCQCAEKEWKNLMNSWWGLAGGVGVVVLWPWSCSAHYCLRYYFFTCKWKYGVNDQVLLSYQKIFKCFPSLFRRFLARFLILIGSQDFFPLISSLIVNNNSLDGNNYSSKVTSWFV